PVGTTGVARSMRNGTRGRRRFPTRALRPWRWPVAGSHVGSYSFSACCASAILPLPAVYIETDAPSRSDAAPDRAPSTRCLYSCRIMNWLAHVFLSESTLEFRLGNLLADIVRGAEREAMSVEFQRGARRHQAIDAFTDAHPVVRRSRARIGSGQRRFSGV